MSSILIKGDTYQDRSHAVLTATRGALHVDAYQSHLQMLPVTNAKFLRIINAGDEVAIAYNKMFKALIDYPEKMRYAVTLEDDMIPPQDALTKLVESMEAHPEMSGISALYYTKSHPKIPLVLGHPEVAQDASPRNPTGFVECNIIPQGLGIFRASMFRELPYPWFQTTRESQDVYFCRRARDKGYRFAVDCNIRAGHLDVVTGEIF